MSCSGADRLVGRDAEIDKISRLMGSVRMVTFTGVGGVGKTRLAAAVAARLAPGLGDGKCRLDLSPVSDPALVEYAVAASLGIADQTDRPVAEVVREHLRDRELLLVLDNCEHLLDAVAALVVPVLRAAPRLRVLCTSRQSMGILGERVVPVAPLAVPPPSPAGPDLEARYPAVALFAVRARMVDPAFAVTAGNAAAVVEICRRVDGLPLGIEIAAAGLHRYPVEALVDGLRIGRGGGPLDAAFAWSYRLCAGDERELWQDLAVFAGSFDLSAVERVGGAPAGRVLDTLGRLVDKSILIREDRPGATRYRLLDTVREYGAARLRHHRGDRERCLRRRHLDWCRDLTRTFDENWFGPDQAAAADLIRAELPNLRQALAVSLAEPDGSYGALTMVTDLAPFWHGCGSFHEGRLWYERILAATGPESGRAWVRLLNRYCTLLQAQGDLGTAATVARRALEQARALGDDYGEAEALKNVGATRMFGGDPAGARPVLDEAVARLTALGAGRADLAAAKLPQAMATLLTGDTRLAAARCDDLMNLCSAHGERWWRGHVLIARAYVALADGDLVAATHHVRESLGTRRDFGDTVGIAAATERLAWIAAGRGDVVRAARLLGAAQERWHGVGQVLYGAPQWQRGHAEAAARCRAALVDRRYEELVAEGAAMSEVDAIRYALDEPRPTRATPSAPPDGGLTPREHEVAELVADGLSNSDIAGRISISPRTAAGHVENILRKLGFRSRAQIAVWVTRRRSAGNGPTRP